MKFGESFPALLTRVTSFTCRQLLFNLNFCLDFVQFESDDVDDSAVVDVKQWFRKYFNRDNTC